MKAGLYHTSQCSQGCFAYALLLLLLLVRAAAAAAAAVTRRARDESSNEAACADLSGGGCQDVAVAAGKRHVVVVTRSWLQSGHEIAHLRKSKSGKLLREISRSNFDILSPLNRRILAVARVLLVLATKSCCGSSGVRPLP